VSNEISAKALWPHVAIFAMAKQIAAEWKLLERKNEENAFLSLKSWRQPIVYAPIFRQPSKSSLAIFAMAKHIAAEWKFLDQNNEENALLSRKS
jgi:hypothetical protein